MKKRKIINDIELTNASDRPKTYFIISAFYLALSYFLYSKTSIFVPTAFMFVIIFVNVIGLGLISLKEQISAHMSGMGGLIGILSTILYKFKEYNLLTPILISIIIAGIVASSRLKLNAHNLLQIGFGTAWGLFCGIVGSILLF